MAVQQSSLPYASMCRSLPAEMIVGCLFYWHYTLILRLPSKASTSPQLNEHTGITYVLNKLPAGYGLYVRERHTGGV